MWSTASHRSGNRSAGPANARASCTVTRATITPACRQALARRRITARIARKGIESSTRLGRYRYVIERCLEWTSRFRRLVRRYDRKASHFLGFVRLACAIICFRRAARLNLLPSNHS